MSPPHPHPCLTRQYGVAVEGMTLDGDLGYIRALVNKRGSATISHDSVRPFPLWHLNFHIFEVKALYFPLRAIVRMSTSMRAS